MKKWLLLISGLLMAPSLLAAVTLTVPMNYQLLAVQGKHLPSAVNNIALSAGQQSVLVQFISQENPYNVNELSALVRSKPIRIDFIAPEQGEIKLKPPILTTPDDIKRYAKQPSFSLIDEKNDKVAYQAQLLTVQGSPLNADYNDMLAKSLGLPAVKKMEMTPLSGSSSQTSPSTAQQPQLNSEANVPAAGDASQDRISQLKAQFMAASPQERKAFLSWAVSQ